jgi:hypothetical protein
VAEAVCLLSTAAAPATPIKTGKRYEETILCSQASKYLGDGEGWRQMPSTSGSLSALIPALGAQRNLHESLAMHVEQTSSWSFLRSSLENLMNEEAGRADPVRSLGPSCASRHRRGRLRCYEPGTAPTDSRGWRATATVTARSQMHQQPV